MNAADSTALLIVDLQNDFADAAGSLAVTGGERIVPIVNARIRVAAAAGSLVVYTQDWHPEHTPHFAPDGGIWPVHCVQGTWGAELHPDLEVVGPVVRKGAHGEDGYSGFSMRDATSGRTIPTRLERLLREHRIDRVQICGLATDYCVLATALDAVRLGFDTSVLTGAVRAVELNTGDGKRALEQLAAGGVVLVAPQG